MDSFLTERAQLKLDAAAVYTALGVNERLFICTSSQVEKLVRSAPPNQRQKIRHQTHVNNAFFSKFSLKEQQGPERGTADILGQMGSKDIATELTNYDWELFAAMHEVPARVWIWVKLLPYLGSELPVYSVPPK